jgi:hypothetical protein
MFVSSNPIHGKVYSIEHYLIKFVSDLRQFGGFLRILSAKHAALRSKRKHLLAWKSGYCVQVEWHIYSQTVASEIT